MRLAQSSDTQAFEFTYAAAEQHTLLEQGASMRAEISFQEAHKRLKEFDMMLVPGGNVFSIIDKKAEPLQIIRAFADLQEDDPSKERTMFAVDTASLFLANQTILAGLSAAIHPDMVTKLEIECQRASQRAGDDRTEILDDRYVVSNARFEITDDDPYVTKKGRRASHARKGSEMRRESNARRTSIMRRTDLRLGGMRVVTTCGSAGGIDAALYLIAALVSYESAEEVSRRQGYTWVKGAVIDSIDV
jgi:transcriptional regulator GlxA family with amidase domain